MESVFGQKRAFLRRPCVSRLALTPTGPDHTIFQPSAWATAVLRRPVRLLHHLEPLRLGLLRHFPRRLGLRLPVGLVHWLQQGRPRPGRALAARAQNRPPVVQLTTLTPAWRAGIGQPTLAAGPESFRHLHLRSNPTPTPPTWNPSAFHTLTAYYALIPIPRRAPGGGMRESTPVAQAADPLPSPLPAHVVVKRALGPGALAAGVGNARLHGAPWRAGRPYPWAVAQTWW